MSLLYRKKKPTWNSEIGDIFRCFHPIFYNTQWPESWWHHQKTPMDGGLRPMDQRRCLVATCQQKVMIQSSTCQHFLRKHAHLASSDLTWQCFFSSLPACCFFFGRGFESYCFRPCSGKLPSLEHPKRGSFTGQYCSICNLNEDEPSPWKRLKNSWSVKKSPWKGSALKRYIGSFSPRNSFPFAERIPHSPRGGWIPRRMCCFFIFYFGISQRKGSW